MKRKYFLLVFLYLVITLGASAQSKYLDIAINFRTDYYAKFSNNQPDERKTSLNTLKLIFTGSVYDGITYKLERRLNDSGILESDKYTSSLENAWFNFAIKKWRLDFTVGKQDILFGTFESNYDPSDMYLISMVFDNFNRSQVGVAARYTWPYGNTISLQVSNVTGEQLSINSNHSFAYTINAAQNFFNNAFITSLGYSLIHSGNHKYFHWLTFGSMLTLKQNFIELDAYAGRYRQNMTMDTDENNFREADNFSVSITDRYRIKQIVLFGKVAYDYQQDAQTNKMSKRSLGTGIGVEYYPINGQDLRLHTVYLFRRNQYGDSWLDRQGNEIAHQISIGVKWNVNLGQLLTLGK